MLVEDGEIREARIELEGAIPAGSVLAARLANVGVNGRNAVAAAQGGRISAAGRRSGGDPGPGFDDRSHAGRHPGPRTVEAAAGEGQRQAAGDIAAARGQAGRQAGSVPRPSDGLARLGRCDRRSANRRRQLCRRRAADFLHPRDDADRCRRLASAGRAGGRRRGRSGQGDSPPRHRRVDRDRPADRAKQGRSPVRGGAIDAVLPQPFERTAVNGFGFVQIVRPRARRLIARAGAGPRRRSRPAPSCAARRSKTGRQAARCAPRSGRRDRGRSRTGSKPWRVKPAARSACAPILFFPCRAGMPSKLKAKSCPICGKPEHPEQAPFCSRACKSRDLLKWLGEGYRIPGPAADPARVDSDPDDG